jgi:hypothetical protein
MIPAFNFSIQNPPLMVCFVDIVQWEKVERKPSHNKNAPFSGSVPFHPFQGERRITQGLQGNRHQQYGVVIGGDTVGADMAANPTAVYKCPFAVLPYPYAYRLHSPATVRLAVARLFVQVLACQTVGAMVAMVTARAVGDDLPLAYLTDKILVAGVILVIPFH